eukprot:CAMPEP_0184644732 /NCGR_PEP_ID=MMETSP0308-20130426/1399_1 /TAXON_ID=38269 /ORGANISM="Gloeochaete witrockiana, Strain SAG 46.84" /LENGTH=159 /DNA_ID=CAMNT_0027073421 /DNA_START=193 /DNA_END=669 /DNA_ORIENTATION=+
MGTTSDEGTVQYLRNALKNAVQALKDTEELLNQSLASKNQEITYVEDQVTLLQRLLQSKEEVILFLQERLDAANAEVDKAQKDIEETQILIAERQKQIEQERLDSSLDSDLSHLGALEKEYESARQEVDALQSQVSEIEEAQSSRVRSSRQIRMEAKDW